MVVMCPMNADICIGHIMCGTQWQWNQQPECCCSLAHTSFVNSGLLPKPSTTLTWPSLTQHYIVVGSLTHTIVPTHMSRFYPGDYLHPVSYLDILLHSSYLTSPFRDRFSAYLGGQIVSSATLPWQHLYSHPSTPHPTLSLYTTNPPPLPHPCRCVLPEAFAAVLEVPPATAWDRLIRDTGSGSLLEAVSGGLGPSYRSAAHLLAQMPRSTRGRALRQLGAVQLLAKLVKEKPQVRVSEHALGTCKQ